MNFLVYSLLMIAGLGLADAPLPGDRPASLTDPIWFEPQVPLSDVKHFLSTSKGLKQINNRNSLGQTGLMYAVNVSSFNKWGNFAYDDPKGLVELLVERGADVNAVSLPSPREEDHSYNNTALHFVAIQPNYQKTIGLLNYLIDAGAEINVKNSLGETPLMWTANLALLEDNENIVPEFFADLADVNMQNNIGDTYLHILIKNKDYIWVQELIKKFGSMFDLSIKNEEGWTVFDLARNTLEPGSLQALQAFKPLGLGDHVSVVDSLGRTPLMLAIIRNDLPFVTRQLEKGASANAKDKTRFGNTPLHFAVIRQHNAQPYVNILLQYKANPNSRNRYGSTPLHYLVMHNINLPERDNIARMLIQAGADPYSNDSKGRSVIALAKKKSPRFADYLKKTYELAKKQKK